MKTDRLVRHEHLDKWKTHDLRISPMAPSYCTKCNLDGDDLTHYECKEDKTVKCSVCQKLFVSCGLMSCPAHSFGDRFTDEQWNEI